MDGPCCAGVRSFLQLYLLLQSVHRTYDGSMKPADLDRASQMRYYLPLLIAPFIFYVLLWRSSSPLPIADDYHAVLGFANQWVLDATWKDKLFHLVNFQHNEYKLIFDSFATAVQLMIVHHVSFPVLNAIGNAFVIPIGIVLVLMFSDARRADGWTKTLMLLPLVLLLFQLQYCATLNWAMASLQNLSAIAFSLWSIYLLSLRSPRSNRLGGVCCVLAICGSGNGFLAALACALMLATQARWKLLLAWFVLIGVASAGYFTHYNAHASQTAPGQSVLRSFMHIHLSYAFSFLGASAATYKGTGASVALGVTVVFTFGLACWHKLYKTHPAMFFSLLFLLITAVGVSGLRSDFGLEQSLASRYRINSNLAVVLSYMTLAITVLPSVQSRKIRQLVLTGAVIVGIGFCALCDRAGYRFLRNRNTALAAEMSLWQHPGNGVNLPDLFAGEPALAKQLSSGFLRPDAEVLTESARLGTYTPPLLPPPAVLLAPLGRASSPPLLQGQSRTAP